VILFRVTSHVRIDLTTGPGRGEPAPIRVAVKLIMAEGQIKPFQAKSGTGTLPPGFDRH